MQCMYVKNILVAKSFDFVKATDKGVFLAFFLIFKYFYLLKQALKIIIKSFN